MTTKEFRNSELFLRNEFEKDGQWGFPIIKRQTINLDNLELIACSDISNHDEYNLHKGIHHFVDDYRFESEYYVAAEPPVRRGESHLSGQTEPPCY